MYKNVTLNEFIAELQKLQAEHGDKELKSIGACSGKLFGMSSPFCLHFEGDRTEYVPAYQQDVKAHPVSAQAQWERTKGSGETVRPIDANYVLGQLADIMREMPTPTELYDDGIYGGLDTAFGLLEKAPTLDARLYQIAPVKADAAPSQKAAGELRHVWARVGMTLDITSEEEKAIFEGDYREGKAAVKQAVMDGRASLDGETYIPEECIRDFDEEYGTNYRDRDEECAWSLDGEYVNVGGPVPRLDGSELPSVERVQELVGQLRKCSEHEYDQHNNYIAEDLADAAGVLSKLAEARVFSSEDIMRETVDGLIEEATERSGKLGFGNGAEQDYEKD